METPYEESKDHDLLARGFAKAIEAYLDDVWDWAEREIISLKSFIEVADLAHVNSRSKTRLGQLQGTIEEIRLRRLNLVVESLRTQVREVKDRNYYNPLQAIALVQEKLVPVIDLVRELLSIRTQIRTIQEASEEDEN